GFEPSLLGPKPRVLPLHHPGPRPEGSARRASGGALRFPSMEMGGASLSPEVREALGRSWKAVMTVGVVAIVIGCIAILVPAVFSVGAAVFAGFVLVVFSAFLTAAAFSAHSIGSV